MRPACRTRAVAVPALLVALLFLTGCASTQRRPASGYPDESYRELGEELAGRQATIFMRNGDIYDGIIARVASDSTSWQLAQSMPMTTVPTDDIREIHAERKGGRAGKGALTGLLIGAGVGFLIGETTVDNDEYYNDVAGVGGAVAFGALGGLIGLVVGSISGSSVVYDFDSAPPPNPQSEPEPEKESTGHY